MRKVTRQIAEAFEARKSRTVGNTTTDGETVWLHGNPIVRRNENEEGGVENIEVSMAGWPTNTTRERINGILDYLGSSVGVWQDDHEQYIGRRRWDDDVREVHPMPERGWVQVLPWRWQEEPEPEPAPEPRRRTLTDLILGPGFRGRNYGGTPKEGV